MKRTLGFGPLLATIYFCVSGGPFGLEPVMQTGAGLSLLLLVLTPVIWSAPAALLTAELTSSLPSEGGYYVWVKRALGEKWGFLCAWWTWVYSWVDTAIYPTLFAAYVGRFLELTGYLNPMESNPWIKWTAGLSVIVPLTLLNLMGAGKVGRASLIMLGVLIAPFAVMVAMGVSRVLGNPHALAHPLVANGENGSSVLGTGLFAVMWNYLGWDSISTVAEEVDEPQKLYPRALAVGVPLVALSYILPALVGLVVLTRPDQWSEGAWVQIGTIVGGKWLGTAVAGVGLISSAGLFSATLLAASRIPFVLAEDRHVPTILSRIHPQWGTPWAAILVSALFYTVFSFQSFSDLTVVDVILYSCALLLEFVALVVLRIKEPDLPRPYRIPGGWAGLSLVVLSPVLLIGFACWSRFHEKGSIAIWFSGAALLSGPVVWGLGRGWQRVKRA